jgi:hypothetical protein
MKTKLGFLFFLLGTFLGIEATPAFLDINFPETVGKYLKFEVDFELNDYPNPYNPDQIDTWGEFVSPAGKLYKVYGFYYEGYDKLDDGAPTAYEILAPSEEENWKIRFSPNEIGRWHFKLYANDIFALTMAPDTSTFSFFVTPSDEKGFISRANNRYLKYDSGDPFIPIGDSYPWWLCEPYRASTNGKEKGTNITKHYLDGMQANGFTYNRFEVNFYEGLSLTGWDFVLRKSFQNYYNQHDAWQMDEIMAYAKEKGINFNVALFASGDLIDHGSFYYLDPTAQTFIYIPDTNSQGIPVTGSAYGCWSLYNTFNRYQDLRYRPLPPDSVGLSENRYEFFTHPDAIAAQKKMFRYIVARWGYCTNLMGFELLDEVKAEVGISGNDLNPYYAPTPHGLEQKMAAWHSLMYDYIKSVDPYDHLISSGAGDPESAKLLTPVTDFASIHYYTDYGLASNPERLTEPFSNYMARFVQYLTATYDKPVALTETGWCAAQECEDPHLYELHNMMWSGLFNGSMGLTAIWAHEVEVLGSGALHQFAGVSAYSRTLPLLDEHYVPRQFTHDGLRWEFLANYLKDKMYGRVQDENFTYFSLWNGNHQEYLVTLSPIHRPPLSSSIFTGRFPVARQGIYQVTWYDTETGAHHSSTQLASEGDSITLVMPQDLRYSTWADAGFKVEFVDGASSLTVYPNPSQAVFNVLVKHDRAAYCRYSIYDVVGKKIAAGGVEWTPENPAFTVNLEDEAAGTYLLVVNFAGNSLTKRMTKL